MPANSFVFLYEQEVTTNIDSQPTLFAFISYVFCGLTAAITIPHYSIIVYGREYEYGNGGIKIKLEPVSF